LSENRSAINDLLSHKTSSLCYLADGTPVGLIGFMGRNDGNVMLTIDEFMSFYHQITGGGKSANKAAAPTNTSLLLSLYNGGSFQKQLVNTLLKMKIVTLNIVGWTQHPVMAALLQDPTWTGNGMLERWTFAFGMKVVRMFAEVKSGLGPGSSLGHRGFQRATEDVRRKGSLLYVCLGRGGNWRVPTCIRRN